MGLCGSKPKDKKNGGASFSGFFHKLLFPFKKQQTTPPSDSISTSSPKIEKQKSTQFENSPTVGRTKIKNLTSNTLSLDEDGKESIKRLGNDLKLQTTNQTPMRNFKVDQYSKNVFIFDKKLANKISHLQKISKRDLKLMSDRKLRREKEKRHRASKERQMSKVLSMTGPNQSEFKNLTTDAKAQLPIGVRGFVTDFKRPNRFSFRYLAPSEKLPVELKKRKFEFLFEQLSELNSSVETLSHSYNNIVKSLIHLQMPSNKREGVMSNLSITSDAMPSAINTREPIDVTLNKIEVSRFIKSETKHKAFEELNELVEELNVSLDEIHVYYDDQDGTFDLEEYAESEFKISLKVYQSCLKRIEVLKAIVHKVLKINNNQLIDMFKL